MTTEQTIQMHKDHGGQGYYTTCQPCSSAQANANRPAKFVSLVSAPRITHRDVMSNLNRDAWAEVERESDERYDAVAWDINGRPIA